MIFPEQVLTERATAHALPHVGEEMMVSGGKHKKQRRLAQRAAVGQPHASR
jgi:hypothetical protein